MWGMRAYYNSGIADFRFYMTRTRTSALVIVSRKIYDRARICIYDINARL